MSLENFFDKKLKFAKIHNIAFSEIENLPYWEFQILLDKINEVIEKDNERILKEEEGLVPIINLGKK